MADVQVLVIEDSKELRDLLVEALDLAGYRVASVGNGQEGIDYLLQNPRPNLIFLDLMMPVMNGFQFKAQLDTLPELADIPIVITSADGHVDTKLHQIGAKYYLKKPLSIDDLILAVEKYSK